jgi:excisionase family DNA binding protein
MAAYIYRCNFEKGSEIKKRKYEKTPPPSGRLSLAETASLFAVDRLTLKKWIAAGQFPEPTKMGKWRLFNEEAVRKLLEK